MPQGFSAPQGFYASKCIHVSLRILAISCALSLSCALSSRPALAEDYTAPLSQAAPAGDFSSMALIDGFMRTVFGLEHNSRNIRAHQVKKFQEPVRFFILDMSVSPRRQTVERFVLDLPKSIDGLRTQVVDRMREANFRIYIVDRAAYAGVVQNWVYRNPNTPVRGKCLVRVQASERGIVYSDAVLVSDEGEHLFKRCLVEEILQGLGPMNDDHRLVHSVFNDSSNLRDFGRFDQYILNMLYDGRVRAGMSEEQVSVLLPQIVSDVRRRLNSN